MTIHANYKNQIQRNLIVVLGDWNSYTIEELVEKTNASSKQALKIQLGILRKKLRKFDRDILFQSGVGYRMVSLLPHPSHL